ncbi:hypothetical protein L0B53_06230 [Vibrio sp. SS-MA-C1-2]|uniref:hypothetical protein n=1 Tax=Vibrio sp. SS-MA-C1-2 TaxID=2908646 RepID=UPI001F1A4467|nr:hypothetical protein [Vibrio sp. SS-MA-C1-2]UJF19172.1 hypothetical protein L0B53_06230 [Vibrio sp. SS-MA-C1-2]
MLKKTVSTEYLKKVVVSRIKSFGYDLNADNSPLVSEDIYYAIENEIQDIAEMGYGQSSVSKEQVTHLNHWVKELRRGRG